MIYGNTQGIKNTILNELEGLMDYEMSTELIIDEHVVKTMLAVTERINKEILIVIDSSQRIVSVGVGDSKTATFGDIEKYMKNRGLNGLISFHTHPNGTTKLSQADNSSLLELKFNLIGAIGKNSLGEERVSIALINLDGEKMYPEEFGPFSLNQLNQFDYKPMNQLVDKALRAIVHTETSQEERAILVGVNIKDGMNILNIDDSMAELKELTYTAGATAVDILIQNMDRVDKNYYLGKGKLEELKIMLQNSKGNLVICNDELNSSQLKSMESNLGVKVIDRTSLILDIFAKHAKTSEGKLQVELAQLKYRLPRLLGLGKLLSRTGGGIGTRGPGEKKLETDRRTIYKEIHILESRLSSLKNIRSQQKKKRVKNQIPVVSLVGYTNAGKSTLFNVLTNSGVLSEDKLFATLDSTTRRLKDTKDEILISDTVGFIDKLPHDLVKAFESTLEEAVESDMLLQVIDSSNENFLKQVQLVQEVLDSLMENDKTMIYVFNKTDKKCENFDSKVASIRGVKVFISAKYQWGIDELIQRIEKELFGHVFEKTINIPYSDSKVMSALHDLGVVVEEVYEEDTIRVKIEYTSKIEPIVGKYISSLRRRQ